MRTRSSSVFVAQSCIEDGEKSLVFHICFGISYTKSGAAFKASRVVQQLCVGVLRN